MSSNNFDLTINVDAPPTINVNVDDSPSVVISQVGTTGPQGPQGEIGPQGPQGIQGPAGEVDALADINDVTITTPSTGQALVYDGLVWRNDDIVSEPAGTEGQIQFNSAGSFGADSGLVWDNVNKNLGIGVASPTAKLDIAGDVKSTGNNLWMNYNSTGESYIRSGSQASGGPVYIGGAASLTTVTASVESTGISLRSPNRLSWTSGTTINTSRDTNISRLAAGVIGIGTGGTNNILGTLAVGRVGIGTQTPVTELDITGNQLITSSDGTPLTINQGNQTNIPSLILNNVGAGNTGILIDRGTQRANLFNNTGSRFTSTFTNAGGHQQIVSGNILGMAADGAFRYETNSSAAGAFSSVMRVKAGAEQKILIGWNADNSEIFNVGYTGSAYFGGNVGLGTQAPVEKLEVIGGNIKTDGHVAIGNTIFAPTGSNITTVYLNGNKLATSAYYQFQTSFGLALHPNIRMGWTATNATAAMDTGLSRLSANKIGVGNGSSGNVSGTLIAANLGIGTETPTEKLEVAGGNIQVDSFSRKIGFKIAGNTNAGYLVPYDANGNTSLINERAAGSIFFSTSNVERVRINGVGNVGVGKTEPLARIDITAEGKTIDHSQIRLSSIISAISTNDVLGGIDFVSRDNQIADNTTGIVSARIQAVANRTHTGTVVDSDIVFYAVGGLGTTLQERLRIAANGIGINSSPSTSSLGLYFDTSGSKGFSFGSSSYNIGPPSNGGLIQGRVAIGDTSTVTADGVNAYLHVNNASTSGANFSDSTLTLSRTGTANQTGTVLDINSSRTANSAFNLITAKTGYSGTPVTQFIVRGDGNVGIGATIPLQKLHVLGNAYLENGKLIMDSATKQWEITVDDTGAIITTEVI